MIIIKEKRKKKRGTRKECADTGRGNREPRTQPQWNAGQNHPKREIDSWTNAHTIVTRESPCAYTGAARLHKRAVDGQRVDANGKVAPLWRACGDSGAM
jgi:hypothetical protein